MGPRFGHTRYPCLASCSHEVRFDIMAKRIGPGKAAVHTGEPPERGSEERQSIFVVFPPQFGGGTFPQGGRGSKPMVPFWGRCTTHFSINFSGDRDVHWGLTDLDLDPWPFGEYAPCHQLCSV